MEGATTDTFLMLFSAFTLQTKVEEKIKTSDVCFPVESDRSKSDHNSVVYDCVLSRPATFACETHEYL